MNRLSYEELIKIFETQTPSELVDRSGFEESVFYAQQMLHNQKWNEELQGYARQVLELLRAKYSLQWNSHWKYDAFLGYAYDVLLFYDDERFAAYQRAFEKAKPPPPELLVALAQCCWSPGKPPITKEKAISLSLEAIKDTQYIEAVQLLRGLYKSSGNSVQQLYWENILEQIKDSGIHLPPLTIY